jgi:hypothetical protein
MKRISITTKPVLACVLGAGAQTRKFYRNDGVEGELKELVRSWDTASVRHDAVSLNRLLADEFTLPGTSKAQYHVNPLLWPGYRVENLLWTRIKSG